MRTTGILSISLLCVMLCLRTGLAQDGDRRAPIRLENVTLQTALDTLMQRYGVSVVYFDDQIRGVRVSALCSACAVTDALDQMLNGTGLTWIRMGQQFVLRLRPERQSHPVTTLSGVVVDSLTGGLLSGVTVLLYNDAAPPAGNPRAWCPTNAFGFFSLRDIVPGKYILSVRAIGFAAFSRIITLSADTPARLDLFLVQEDIPMQEFTVEGYRTASTPAEGIVHGTYIRSIPSDQTQYLLDGARVFNPSHFGGAVATFEPSMMNDIEPTVKGLPPFYGGRIGGLLDLSLREGSGERVSGTAGIGSLGGHLFLEGPLGGSTTFLLSGRRTYPYPAFRFTENDNTPNRLGSYEIIGKLQHRLSGSSRLYLSGYLGEDLYRNTAPWSIGQFENSFRWTNQNLNARWFGISSSSLFLYGSLAYARYDLQLAHASDIPFLYGPLNGKRVFLWLAQVPSPCNGTAGRERATTPPRMDLRVMPRGRLTILPNFSRNAKAGVPSGLRLGPKDSLGVRM
jgi:hypothetical protein